jgi:hypothetical protein
MKHKTKEQTCFFILSLTPETAVWPYQEWPCWSPEGYQRQKRFLVSPKKHILDKNSHFEGPVKPLLVQKIVISSQNKLLIWHFYSILAVLT